MFHLLAAARFDSPWYWVLHVVVWTLACQRTLGVPYDMLLRARRLPQVARRVGLLAGIESERVAAVREAAGPPLAAVAGFALAASFVFGFVIGLEAGQTILALLLPLALITASKVELAGRIGRGGLDGAALVRTLTRRRAWHQAIGMLGMLGAATVAALRHAGLPIG